MDKFALLRQRKAAVEVAEARSTAVADAFSARLALPRPETPTPVLTGNDKFQQRFALVNSELGFELRGNVHSVGAEMDRITKMQIVQPMEQEECEAYNRENTIAGSNFRLFNLQCEAALAYEQFSGLFAPIGVGWGTRPACAANARRAQLEKQA